MPGPPKWFRTASARLRPCRLRCKPFPPAEPPVIGAGYPGPRSNRHIRTTEKGLPPASSRQQALFVAQACSACMFYLIFRSLHVQANAATSQGPGKCKAAGGNVLSDKMEESTSFQKSSAGYSLIRRHTAWQAMPLLSPVKPRCSSVVALTLICSRSTPRVSAMFSSICRI